AGRVKRPPPCSGKCGHRDHRPVQGGSFVTEGSRGRRKRERERKNKGHAGAKCGMRD
ncbi:hypothetical protein KI387_024151, partial [Taxus chinensis]